MSPGSIEVHALMTGTVLAVLALAAREDILRQRIPNVLTGAAVLAAVGFAWISDGLSGLVHSVAGVATGLALFLPFYALRGMGAGDVKLMAAVGAFLGPGNALLAALLALVAGMFLAGALAARCVFAALSLRQSSQVVAVEAPASLRVAAAISSLRGERIPYATAIGTGAVATLYLNGALGSFWTALGLA